jgi:hypothetical protein
MIKSVKSGKTHVIPQVTPPLVRLAMMAGFSWAALVALARALPVVQTVFYDMPSELIDAACSPNYERPKDIVAALEYIVTRSDLNRDRLAWIGFSHGSQTGMNALLDASVNLGDYEVDYIDLVDDGNGGLVEDSVKKAVPGPVRIPGHLPMPRFCAFYYGGGGHFGYHGQSSSTAAGRYMLDRRTTAILFHGSDDYLLSADHDFAL